MFNENATAGKSTINNGDSASFGSASIRFNDDSTAAEATINNAGFGTVTFSDRSTAGFATITNNDAGILTFRNRSSADNATIVNNADGLFGGVEFLNRSTAGNAFITTNNGALTIFSDRSDGGTARFETALGGTVDFSETKGPDNDGKINAGSIAGAGHYFIGANNTLTVGGNNLSTEVSGVIADFNPCGCGPVGPGALVKTGTGTMTSVRPQHLYGRHDVQGRHGIGFAGGEPRRPHGWADVRRRHSPDHRHDLQFYDTRDRLGDRRRRFRHRERGKYIYGQSGSRWARRPDASSVWARSSCPAPTAMAAPPRSRAGRSASRRTTVSMPAALTMLDGTTLQFTGSFDFTHPTSVAGDPAST